MQENKTFKPADYKEASESLCSLDLAAIDSVIDSGIPLNVPEYALGKKWTKTDALGAILHAASYEFGYMGKNKNKGTYEDYKLRVDKAAARLIERCNNLSIFTESAVRVFANKLYDSSISLLNKGIDVNATDSTGKNILYYIQQSPEIKEYFESKSFQSNKAATKIELISGNKLSEFSNEKLEKLFTKFLVKRQSDLVFSLLQPAEAKLPGYRNPYSMSIVFSKAYYNIAGKSAEQSFHLLFKCLHDELAKKKVQPAKLIENAYHILCAIKCRIPLKRLTEIASGKDIPTWETVMNETPAWAWWELKSKNERRFTVDIQAFDMDFNKKEDMEKLARQLTEHFDDYVMCWRYDEDGDLNFRITDLSDRRDCKDEDKFFAAVLQFPELEPLVTSYVEKITAHNKNEVLYCLTGDYAVPRGRTAAAAMALMNEKNDSRLLAYLNSFPEAYLDQMIGSVYREIRYIWETAGKIPHLPETFAAHPMLTQQN